MINDGDKVLDDNLTAIRTKFDPRTILFEPFDPSADVVALAGLPSVRGVVKANGAYEISLSEGIDPTRALGELASTLPAARVALNRPTLEDVFIRIVTGGRDEGAEDVAQLRAALRDEAAAGGGA